MEQESLLPPRVELLTVQQTLRWVGQPYAFLRDCRARHGGAFTLDFGSHGTYVMFSQKEAINEIFTAGVNLLHAGKGNAVLKPLLGPNSLLIQEERSHQRERRMLLPAFHARRIERYGEIVRASTLDAITDLGAGREIVMQDLMQRISLQVILRAVFGLEGGARAEELAGRFQALLNDSKFNLTLLGQLRDDLETASWAGFRGNLEHIDRLLLEEVAHRRALGDGARDDMLGLLLSARYEDGAPLDDAVLHDELMTLMVTGYETTATALAWAFHWLHEEPDALDRLRAELAGLGVDPTPAELASRAPFLRAVCQETLRIHPIIPVVARVAQATFEMQGYRIPAGTTIAACIYLAHHDPAVYQEPDRFRPERFIDREYSPYEYLPFGGGARRCLGMSLALYEMKVVLGTILARLALRPERRGTRPVRRAVTIAPSRGLPMIVDHAL